MKNFIYSLLLWSLFACSKKSDPQPAPEHTNLTVNVSGSPVCDLYLYNNKSERVNNSSVNLKFMSATDGHFDITGLESKSYYVYLHGSSGNADTTIFLEKNKTTYLNNIALQ